jgi:hypothetical protein
LHVFQVIEQKAAVLEEEEAETPGANGLLGEAEDILSQLAALKRLLREVSDGIFTGLASLPAQLQQQLNE